MYNEKHLKNIGVAIDKAKALYDNCICCGHICGVNRNENKIGRNDPCPCGSGKKYKKCCGKNK